MFLPSQSFHQSWRKHITRVPGSRSKMTIQGDARTSPVQNTEGARHLFHCGAAPEYNGQTASSQSVLPHLRPRCAQPRPALPLASAAEAGNFTGRISARGCLQQRHSNPSRPWDTRAEISQLYQHRALLPREDCSHLDKGEQRDAEKRKNTARGRPL